MSKLVHACPHLPSKLSGYDVIKQSKERDNRELQITGILIDPGKVLSTLKTS